MVFEHSAVDQPSVLQYGLESVWLQSGTFDNAEGGAMDQQAVLQRAAEAHLRLVRFMYCDNGGIIRGKATHVNGLARRMVEGIGQTLAMQAFASIDALAAVEGMGPVGEFRL